MTDLAKLIAGSSGVVGAFNKHSQVGESISGTLTEISLVQLTDYMTQQPKFWDDAKTEPQMQIRLVFQADPGTWTPQSEDDTGMRSHHIKAWGIHLKTFREAMQRAGEGEPVSGGHIRIRFDREEPSNQGSPTKVFEYEYQAPASGVSQVLNGNQPQAQQAPQQTPVPPVANVHTAQGQVDPATGEIVGQAAPVAPVPAQQAQQPQQAAVDPWTGQPVTQQPQQPQQPAPAQQPQPAAQPQAGPAAGAGMDSAIMKLVQAGLDDNTILATLGSQGVTAQQISEVRASLGQ